MLDDMASSGSQNIVSWQPHGKAFRVHQPEVFARTIIPRYFSRQTQYKSFQRQLHIYGFHRIVKGIDKGAYYHALFIRNKKSMSLRMIRQRIKGTAGSSSRNDAGELQQDPHFYSETADDQHQCDRQDHRRALSDVSSIIFPETASSIPSFLTSTSSLHLGGWVDAAETILSKDYYSYFNESKTCSNIQSGGNIVNATQQETCFSSGGGDEVFGKKIFFVDNSHFSSLRFQTL
jgi:hypothetical protein